MGVDHTAFAVYGVRIDCTEPDTEKIDLAIRGVEGVGYCEWGARYYGGAWGYLLTYGDTYEAVDFDRGVGVRALPRDRDMDGVRAVSALQDAVHAIKKAGIKCAFYGEPGWFVGGHTC